MKRRSLGFDTVVKSLLDVGTGIVAPQVKLRLATSVSLIRVPSQVHGALVLNLLTLYMSHRTSISISPSQMFP